MGLTARAEGAIFSSFRPKRIFVAMASCQGCRNRRKKLPTRPIFNNNNNPCFLLSSAFFAAIFLASLFVEITSASSFSNNETTVITTSSAVTTTEIIKGDISTLIVTPTISSSSSSSSAANLVISDNNSSTTPADLLSLTTNLATSRIRRGGKLAAKLVHKWMTRNPNLQRPLTPYGRCGPPPPIPNAKWNYFMSGMPLRARVQYHCLPGYLLEGDDTIMCSDDGRWSDVPACLGTGIASGSESDIKIEAKAAAHANAEGCGPMPRVENGFIKDTSLVGPFSRIGDYIIFDCASGFIVEGTERIECLTGKKWSSAPPVCVAGPTQRPPLPTCGKAQLLLPNAYAAWASYSVHQDAFPGDRVQYTCTPGFRMLGNNTIICLPTGEWSDVPTCHASNTNCTSPDPPKNGFLVGVNNGTATFACQNGYTLVGTATVICQPDNTWSIMPRCRESSSTVTCPDPPRVVNSRQITSFGQGETPRLDDYVTYQCFYRYYLDGAATLVCKEDGKWSPDPPVCRAVGAPTTPTTTTEDPGCAQQPPLPNTVVVKYFDGIARSGDVLEYHCIDGYEPTASSGRAVCTPNRRWAVDPNFACRVSAQSEMTTEMAPFEMPTTTQQPYCPAAVEIDNGRMAVFYLGRARPGDMVEYKCLEGFTLEGTARIRCLDDYTWSSAPRCVAQEAAASGCTRAPTVENGYVVSSSSSSADGSFQAGDFVTFACLVGYQLVGNKNAYCLTSGRWTTRPRCSPSVPEPATLPTSPTTTITTTTKRTTPTTTVQEVTVVPWWMMETEETSTVLTTKKRPAPTTQPAPLTTIKQTQAPTTRSSTQPPTTTVSSVCSDLASPPYAIRELTSYWMAARPGDFVRFRCLPGYNLVGNNRVVCQSDGTWSLIPSCIASVIPTTQPPAVVTRPSRTTRATTTTTEYIQTEPPWTEPPEIQQFTMRQITTQPSISGYCSQAPHVANAAQMPSFRMGSVPLPGDYVDYVCGSGFNLVGSPRVTCQANLRWSAAPYCQLVQTCSQPPTIANGIYMPTSPQQSGNNPYKPGDSVSISCMTGFDLVGGSLIYCLASGEWSQAPVCMPSVNQPVCSKIPAVENAIQVTQTFQLNANIGDYAKFKCQPGFLMIGNETATCQTDGTWTGLPKCVRSCPDPPRIENGRMKGASYNGRSPLPGDSVLVECNANFTLSGGVNYMLCRSDNTWTSAPTCIGATRGQVCGTPPPAPNADIVQKSFTEGNQARKGDFIVLQCRTGFITEDSVTIVCGEDGTWSRTPNCQRETACPTLADIPNGQLIDKTWQSRPRKGDTATFRCLEGTELRGNPLVVCKVDGTWSTLPTCEKVILCDMPPSVEHATVTYRTFNAQPRRGDAVTFDCSSGYEVIGFRTAYCKDDGTWSALPVCQKIGCGPVLPAPLSAIISNRSFTDTESKFGDYVVYACNPGFRASTSTTATCQSNGLWTQLPDCQPITCGVLPPLPVNSRVVFKSFDNNARINEFFDLSCDSGYVLEGRAVVQCMANGEWTEMPRCRKITCQVPVPIPYATASVVKTESAVNELVSNQLFAIGDRVRFDCNEGYSLKGPSTICCQSNGEWSEMPYCQEMTCPPPPQVENTVVETKIEPSTVFIEGFEVNFSCQAGYRFQFNSPIKMVCKQTKWSPCPICEPIDCGRPPSSDNAQVRFTSSNPGGIATYTCRSGYTVVDRSKSGQLTCSQNGTWTPSEPPKCQQVLCDDQPVNVDFATVNITGNTVGSFANYACQTGFKMIGPEQSVCGPNGKWSDAPICLSISCQPPKPIDNGRFTSTGLEVGDTITWFCNDDYTLIGDSRSICKHDLTWDQTPICEFISCTDIGNFPDGTVRYSAQPMIPNTVASFQCLPGYALVNGDAQIVCQKNGTWSNQPGRCMPVPICAMPSLPNGYVLPNQTLGFPLGAVIQFFCNSEFQLNGSALATCTESGAWTHIPSCVACPPITTVHNGQVIGNGKDPNVGTSIDIICDPGYRPDQPHTTLTCGSDGHWSYLVPRCITVTCEKPKISFGALTTLVPLTSMIELADENPSQSDAESPDDDEEMTYFLPGAHIRLICQPGYRPLGANASVCLNNGQWSTPLGTCIRATCTLPPKPANGRMARVADVGRGSSEPVKGETVRFSCDNGYKLVGVDDVRCLESGQWSDPFPQCVEIRCMNPPKVDNGFVAANGGFKVGSAVVVTCDNGFKLKGDPIVRCLEDGQWDTIPVCENIVCTMPPAIENGRVVYDSSLVGGRAQYRCNRGFSLTGPSVLTCQSSGKWTPDVYPHCTEIICNQPPLIPNGVIAMHQDPPKVGAVATYICLDGYQIDGPQMIICTEAGVWTSTLPNCRPVQCGLPPMIANTSADLPAERDVGVRIVYSCVSGTTGFGDPTSVCQTNGTWTVPNFACKPSTCPEPPMVSNGDIMRLSGQSPGDYAEYKCRIGYQLIGSNIVTCLRDGSWSDSPMCIGLSNGGCTAPPEIANADVSFSSTVVGALATYTCRTGYRAIGNPVVSCTAAGIWTDPPSCREVVCYGPPAVANAEILRLTGYSFGSSATYRCKQRYQMLGDPTIICGQNGVWSSMPTCVAHTCGMPPIPANSIMVFATYSMTAEASKPGDSIRYVCLQDYMLIGNDTIVCGQTGIWSMADFQCRRLTCADPPSSDVPHATIAYKSFAGQDSSPHDYVIYSCDPGYQLIGNATIVCRDVTWSRFEFICQRMTCGDPPMIVPYAYVSWRSYDSPSGNSVSSPGDTVRYACQDGFTLIGNDTIGCNANVWSAPLFGCRKTRRCLQVPPTPDNAQALFTSFPSETGTVANAGDYIVYGCSKGYTLRGRSNVTCIADDSWTPLPTCERERKSCGPAPIIQNAFIDQKSFASTAQDGDSALYRCAAGFLIAGNAVVECHNGEWSVPPFCKPSQCSILPAVTNGTIVPSCSELICRAGEQVLVSCLPGFVLAGSPVITCVGDNSWSDLPVCLNGISVGLTTRRPPPLPPRYSTQTMLPATVTLLPARYYNSFNPMMFMVTTTPVRRLPNTVTIIPPRQQMLMTSTVINPDLGCYVGPHIPAMVAQNEQSYVLTSSVHVFPDLMFTCTGTIRRWSFYCLSRYYERAEIYLDVWRPTQQVGTSRFDYQLIGSNLVRSMVYGYNQIEVGPGQQLEAQVGDVIGFHYSNNSIGSRFLVIPLADEADPWPFVSSDLVRVLSNDTLSHDDVMDLNGLVSFRLLLNQQTRQARRQLPLIQAVVVRSDGQQIADSLSPIARSASHQEPQYVIQPRQLSQARPKAAAHTSTKKNSTRNRQTKRRNKSKQQKRVQISD